MFNEAHTKKTELEMTQPDLQHADIGCTEPQLLWHTIVLQISSG